jgi:putative tricarboxylic transport membrane protein
MAPRAGALVVGAAVMGLGVFFLLGTQMIEGEAAQPGVGPRAFPTVIGAALVVLGALFAVAVRRGLPFAAASGPAARGVLLWIIAGIVGGILAIEPLGFPAAAAWLFVMGARGFGSRRWAHNVVIGVIIGLVVYLVFARALGVSLPGGPLDTLWPRG